MFKVDKYRKIQKEMRRYKISKEGEAFQIFFDKLFIVFLITSTFSSFWNLTFIFSIFAENNIVISEVFWPMANPPLEYINLSLWISGIIVSSVYFLTKKLKQCELEKIKQSEYIYDKKEFGFSLAIFSVFSLSITAFIGGIIIFGVLFFVAKTILNIICSRKTSKKERRKDEKALEYLFNEILNDSNELKYLKSTKYTNRSLYNKVLDEIMTSKKDYIFEKYCNEKEQEEKNKECLNEVLSNIENV